ncbi:DUF4282 domain-containing protein (plasmid) [Curtobacterium sp. TC1]|uniref:DUF4282 domain-containing protein n=1 Tax=Curtobacterium sp. TC1 TaxID=2862880 RepID=UPI001C9B9A03|nr:DUF4282 domain-containing protein [Curtobacterium sp. TC1]QZQ53735.1 DUF4282 domain-containing protein [Curtobacterium sp. TC1]
MTDTPRNPGDHTSSDGQPSPRNPGSHTPWTGQPTPQNPGGSTPPAGGGQPPYGAGGPLQGPDGWQSPPPLGDPKAKGFFGALFDFSFNHFVTPIIVKIVYILVLVALVIGWLIAVITGFAQNVGIGLVFLIIGAIGVIVYLALIRMTLELYLSIVRMSEDIHHRLPRG